MSKQWAQSGTGEFKRQVSSFRETISATHPIYKPAKGRYWLYVSLACPWAHRTIITRALKGLTSVIGVSVVHWHLDEKGWRFLPADSISGKDTTDHFSFSGGIKGSELDVSHPSGDIPSDSKRLNIDANVEPNCGFNRLREFYLKSNPDYSARFTVPVLWDLETKTIVNNESADIIRILNSGVFDEFVEDKEYLANKRELVPKQLEAEIDDFNTWVYDGINNGVYKAGFSENQAVYEREVTNVFNNLDKVEAILKKKHSDLESKHGKGNEKAILSEYFTVGNQLTEADVRFYTTIVRFDPVYVQHFKCNFNTIRDGYPFIHLWLRNLYWNYDAFKLTTNFDHIKLHYTRSHPRINPLGLTPLGPKPDIMNL
ncbi:hypothetical protein Kpol_489p17 [Vanderwaltozyma polyspora DSM 70294]|uniref:GST N-terminal domain-containing protein n=1 Tax=Vanderwaltozyma polyspora (strain ATCC 22028 / DSM 70294 / BCRC 21397 / CBS 2163 / NBRC 10782 / NRRL Y-8283 / UCD 57-17) TaxID=436907 RepID=A7TQ31_VANPO|nr:uncharacterized protein Kpol_489p17 [Vanderwaltozyma polyspora DSM 70294]EDO15636.1 hypothetical protein Kpol_489p17 [Vanderwaltozyma polyspora DSM 70294]